MGQSGTKGQVLSGPGQGPSQQSHPPEPPYPGPAAQYQFVNVEVMISHHVNFGFMSSQMITSNVEAYYPLLAQQYDQGYRLLSFYRIPGQIQHTGGLFSRNMLIPFQGIFCRYPQQPSSERFQLRIEKSVIQPLMQWNGFITTRTDTVTDTSHLLQTIANNTQNGGRLICIELTGQEETHANYNMHTRQRMVSAYGCDLLFELPLSGYQEQYIYNVACIPITCVSAGGFSNRIVAQCDWLGVMAQYLGQGYKLVEIFMDKTASTQVRGFSATITMNSQWFFEKPLARRDDPTPMYQGTVVEHMISISQGFSGARTTANWEPIMQNMGNKGWELACVLETPEMHHGFGTAQMKVLLFFQRRILH